ncbi:hypothetical protein EI94DRAFT_1804116 [Lactarius quietus]|nr:hypothetical protein EI94DRAFT_1804116 [Lactarius quietus]
MFARYELYIAHHFVSHHKPASRRSTPIITNSPDSDSPSFTSTPSDYSTDLLSDGAGIAAAAEPEPEPDGASLYCISVRVIVFKHGRIGTSRALALERGVWRDAVPLCAHAHARWSLGTGDARAVPQVVEGDVEGPRALVGRGHVLAVDRGKRRVARLRR